MPQSVRWMGLAVLAAALASGCATSHPMQINEGEWMVQSRALSEEGAVKDAVSEATNFCKEKGKKPRILKMEPVASSGDTYSRRQATFTCE